jgi:hypothetical protein
VRLSAKGNSNFKGDGKTMNQRIIIFRGQIVRIVEERIQTDQRDPQLIYYGIRHGDDLGKPVSIENKEILVNWFGYLIANEPLNFKGSDWIKPSRKEQRELSLGDIQLIDFMPNTKIIQSYWYDLWDDKEGYAYINTNISSTYSLHSNFNHCSK